MRSFWSIEIKSKHYYFSRSRLYYTWKPKDVKAATLILFNYEIFYWTFYFLDWWCELSLKPGDLFQYIKMIPPFIPSRLDGIIWTGPYQLFDICMTVSETSGLQQVFAGLMPCNHQVDLRLDDNKSAASCQQEWCKLKVNLRLFIHNLGANCFDYYEFIRSTRPGTIIGHIAALFICPKLHRI